MCKMINRALYVDRHLYYFVRLEGDGSVFNKVVNGIDLTVTFNAFDAQKLLEEQSFDALGVHLSTNFCYYVAVKFRKKNKRGPIIIHSGLAGDEFVKRDLKNMEFPYDMLIPVSIGELLVDHERRLEDIARDFKEFEK